MGKQRLDDYYATVAGRPWLHVLESSVTHIPQKLADIDPHLFVVFNKKQQQFEVHDAACPIQRLSYVLSAPELDDRIVKRVDMARMDREPILRAEMEAMAERVAIEKRADDARLATVESLHDLASERAVVKVK